MNYGSQMRPHLGITPTVKWLLIANGLVWFVFQVILENMAGLPFSKWFALYPAKLLFDFTIWQPLTYMFLHSYQVTHILFNMLMLWFLGTELEQRWGRRFFLAYYLLSGFGAAIIYCVGTWIYFLYTRNVSSLAVPVMGASGAIFGLLVAYGILFGERVIHFMMLFPMKAKYFVLILGVVEVANLMTSNVNGGDVAYLAHLGGLVAGYITLKFWGRMQRWQWNLKSKKRKTGNLRLVVDNEKPKKEPRYWN